MVNCCFNKGKEMVVGALTKAMVVVAIQQLTEYIQIIIVIDFSSFLIQTSSWCQSN